MQARAGTDLEVAYRSFVQIYLADCDADNVRIGALLIEPLMIGAGGLKFIDPLYQKVLVQECKARGMPIVYDEVCFPVDLLYSPTYLSIYLFIYLPIYLPSHILVLPTYLFIYLTTYLAIY